MTSGEVQLHPPAVSDGARAGARPIWQHRGVDVDEFNALEPAAIDRVLGEVCPARQWIVTVREGRPYVGTDDLFAASDRASAALGDDGLEAALAGHPRIGERPGPATPTDSTSTAAAREQAGVDVADAELIGELAAANRAYEERFGRIYLVCASGRTGPELLAILRQRLEHDDVTEVGVTRDELAKINRLRLGRMVGPSAS